MSRVDDALARMEAALVRIEQAGTQKRKSGTDLELAAELRQTREDYAALKDKTDGVARRLDAAIERLSGILGEAAE